MAKLDDTTRQELISAALKAQKQAYIPYSHFPVGAAILTSDGTIYTGCNVENASYGATICAERTAGVKAVSEGARKFRAVAVVTNNAVYPCGLCRQFLVEFAENKDVLIIAADSEGKIAHEITLGALMPGSFGPEELEIGQNARKHGTP